MFPYALGVLTLLQGLYSLLWIVILMDVGSPTLDLRSLPAWTPGQILVLFPALLAVTFAIGVVMHTLSRQLFRSMKDGWESAVLTSGTVTRRLGDAASCQPSGGPCLAEVHAVEGIERVRKVGEFVHALDYVLMLQSPHLHRSIQVYRDQYRLARGFILPSLILAVLLPFWAPVPLGHVERFPLISVQLFFLGLLAAGVSMYAFRERAHRYAAARIRAFVTLQAERGAASEAGDGKLAAVG